MDYYDLGSYSRKITTAVPEAQLWFDRGLKQRLDLALARSEVPVKASCFCRMKVAA